MASRMAARAFARTACGCSRSISSTSRARAISEFKMPSMSPTMEQGKISSWKLKEGDKFSAGDVLLTVETDKAEVDVEAQDDGVMGKIILDEKESVIKVGQTIALLAEEGDDITNLEVPESSSTPSTSQSAQETKVEPPKASPPKEDKGSPSSGHAQVTPSTSAQPFGSHGPAPKHTRPLLPSVLRLLMENGSPDISSVKGTGVRGQLTKGDILAFLGKISSPYGTAAKFQELKKQEHEAAKKASSSSATKKPESQKILSGAEFRRYITAGLRVQSPSPRASPAPVGFDDILEGYFVPPTKTSFPAAVPQNSPSVARDPYDAVLTL